jgi:uncharacterized protein (TIRG00374 family)
MIAARLLLAAFIVAVLFWNDVIDARALVRVLSDPLGALPAVAMLGAAFLLGGLRWYLILRAFKLPLRFRSVFEIYAIGAFFNTFLPGGTGGDVLRVLYIVRGVESGRLRAAVSVIADRAAGLYGMLLFAISAFYANATVVFGSAATAALGSALMLAFVAITIVATVILVAARPIQRARRVQSWAYRGGALRIAHRGVEMLALFRGELRVLAGSVAVSIGISLLLVGSIVTLAASWDWGTLTPLDYACAGVFALLAGSVPLTPGGIGIAEGAFAYVCQLWSGSGSGAAYGTIFLGYRLVAAVISLTGAIAFITHRRPGAPSKSKP